MKAKTLQILWHDRQPIYSCHFEPQRPNDTDNNAASSGYRVATSGGDSNVRLWRVMSEADDTPPRIDYLCTLSRHTGAVNVVRFSPVDEILATAGDDCTILLWRPSGGPVRAFGADKEDTETEVESWAITGSLRGTADIYDLAWSPDGQYIISASIDNLARIWNVRDRRCIHTFYGHHHYVQGVAWDPLGEYVATQSGDRTVQVYRYTIGSNGHFNVKSTCRHSRRPLTDATNNVKTMTDSSNDSISESTTTTSGIKHTSMYENETLTSFFRRLSFTIDGSMLMTPAGLAAQTNSGCTTSTNTANDQQSNSSVTFLFTRNQLQHAPVAQLPTLRKPSVATRCSPVLYRLRPNESSFIQLPYRIVYAIASQDGVTIHDTQQMEPLAIIANMHYATLTDLSWSWDGRQLMFTSTDGYCSLVVFEEGELGEPLSKTETAAFLSRRTPNTVQSNTNQSIPMEVSETPTKKPFVIINTSSNSNSSNNPSTTISSSNPSTTLQPTAISNSTAPKKRRITPTLISKLPS